MHPDDAEGFGFSAVDVWTWNTVEAGLAAEALLLNMVLLSRLLLMSRLLLLSRLVLLSQLQLGMPFASDPTPLGRHFWKNKACFNQTSNADVVDCQIT